MARIGKPKRRIRVEPLPDRRERPREPVPEPAPAKEPAREEPATTPDREKVPA
jgi:hypothetical protein